MTQTCPLAFSVCQSVEEGKLVAGDEQPRGQQPLDVAEELNLLLGGRGSPGHFLGVVLAYKGTLVSFVVSVAEGTCFCFGRLRRLAFYGTAEFRVARWAKHAV
jgi:hypothetical protein